MKILLSTPRSFISKKTGTEFTSCDYVALNGSVGQIFTTKEKFDAFDVPKIRFASAEDFAEMLKEYELSDVDFDNKGNIIALS